MLSEKEVALVFETLISSPGMNEVVKLDLRLPRKNVLLLVKVIEKGLLLKKGEAREGLLEVAGTVMLDELQGIGMDLLQKAGLSDMNEKLNALQLSPIEKQ